MTTSAFDELKKFLALKRLSTIAERVPDPFPTERNEVEAVLLKSEEHLSVAITTAAMAIALLGAAGMLKFIEAVKYNALIAAALQAQEKDTSNAIH